MRPQKVDDELVMEKMIPLFRAQGYDGTSMQDLAEATGLKKASLYHRFPGGKEDMALSVMAYAGIKVKKTIIEHLLNKQLEPQVRLNKALEGIKNFYDGGKASCLLRALSSGSPLPMINEKLEIGMSRWIEAFKILGLDYGFSDDEASHKATQSLVLVQGSLVVGRTLNSTKPFLDALLAIREMYK